MVERVDPKLGESIMDPACGTGGFLACAFDHVKIIMAHTVTDHQILQKQIHGVEKKQLPHLLCTTNMRAARHRSASARSATITSLNKTASLPDEQMDVISHQLPFGGTEEDGIDRLNFLRYADPRNGGSVPATDH